MANAELKLLLEELLAPLGPVTIKRMFGGYGLFLDGLMFGLLSDDRLYFKADEASRATYEAEGSGPFTYVKQGGSAVLTSYWQVPERLLDEADELVSWARVAHRSAVSAQKTKRVTKPRTAGVRKRKS